MWLHLNGIIEHVHFIVKQSHNEDNIILAKQLHNSDPVSENFNHFSCMAICNKLSRHLRWSSQAYTLYIRDIQTEQITYAKKLTL